MSYYVRVAQTGFPAAVFLGCLGYILGTFSANSSVSGRFGNTIVIGDAAVALSFPWQLALAMAASGFGLMAIYQMFAMRFSKPKRAKTKDQFVDTESMLLELLDQADAAEKVRQSSIGFIR